MTVLLMVDIVFSESSTAALGLLTAPVVGELVVFLTLVSVVVASVVHGRRTARAAGGRPT